MNTHACARARANTPAHACMRTHPHYTHARRHMHACARAMCIRAPRMHACARTTYMHAYARARANTPAHAHALVQKHAHIFCCALTDGVILLSCELCLGRPYLSWLFGLVCIALTWPRLRRQRWWWRLSGLAGHCQWEWWRSLRPPAGRAMPCIKLLPLPPPCGSHWLVGGFQQCRVCFLSCCSTLARRLPCQVVVL